MRGSVYYDAASSLRSLSLNSSGGGTSSTRAPAPAAEAKAAAEGAAEAVEGRVESDPRPWMRTHELRTEGSFDAAVRAVAAARDAVAIGAGRVQEIPGTGIQARVKLARRIREHCDTCLELCREKFGDPPVGDEFFTTYTCLMVLGKWHHGLASLPSVHKFVVRTVFGKMPHYSYEEAAAAHKKQLEMHPHIPLPRMELGRVLIGMGDKAAAAAHLDAFLEQAPGDKYSGKRFKLHREAGDMLKATGVAPKRAAKATLSAAGWGRK
eukprot:PRCOL_00003357-RA